MATKFGTAADKATGSVAQREHAEHHYAKQEAQKRYEQVKASKSGGGGSGRVSDTKEMQLGADLDPKAMMKREGYKKGGMAKSASARADGCAVRGKTRA